MAFLASRNYLVLEAMISSIRQRISSLQTSVPVRWIRNYAIDVKQVGSTKTHPPKIMPIELLAQAFLEYQNKFPKDIETNSLIAKYNRFNQGPLNIISVGVLYDQQYVLSEKSSVIEGILADPLSDASKFWYQQVVDRDHSVNNRFSFGTTPEVDASGIESRYTLSSPLLSSALKDRFRNSFQKEILDSELNNIELLEINDISEGLPDCHFYFYVTPNLSRSSNINLDDKIVITVVDNPTYQPPVSTKDSPVVFGDVLPILSINSRRYFDATSKFLEIGPEAGLQFANSIIESNILELQKTLTWYLSTPILKRELLLKIHSNLLVSQGIGMAQSTKYLNQIKSEELAKFGEIVHTELQSQFIPETTDFFARKLRWWKMYWKNDNVEYDLKDFFGVKFMPQSIEYYNFLRGKIVLQLQSERYASYTGVDENVVENPLLQLKTRVIQQDIPTQVQPVVFAAISTAFLYYQLPLSIIGATAYQFFDFSIDSSVAIGLLGWVVGFNHASKKWETFTKIWTRNLFEEVRICLSKDCIEEGLVKESAFRYREETEVLKGKERIIEVVERNLAPK